MRWSSGEAVGCRAERAGHPGPAVGYAPRGRADRPPPGRGRGDASWPPGLGIGKAGRGAEQRLVETERRRADQIRQQDRPPSSPEAGERVAGGADGAGG